MASSAYGVWAEAVGELISYRHVGCRSVLGDGFAARGQMSLRRDLRHGGGPLAAPVAIAMLDTAGIAVDRHWQLALTHVEIILGARAGSVSTLAVHGSMTRQARSQIFTEARFVDAGDEDVVIGVGTADWTVIASTPMGFEYIDPGCGPDDVQRAPLLVEVFGGIARSGGGFVIEELTPRLGGPVLHHGPILVTLEAAALHAAGDGLRVAALNARIVKAGKQGPFIATAKVMSDDAGTMLVRAEMVQGGDPANVVAVAVITMRSSTAEERISR